MGKRKKKLIKVHRRFILFTLLDHIYHKGKITKYAQLIKGKAISSLGNNRDRNYCYS